MDKDKIIDSLKKEKYELYKQMMLYKYPELVFKVVKHGEIPEQTNSKSMIIRKATELADIEVTSIQELKNLCDKEDHYLVQYSWLKEIVASAQPKIISVDVQKNSIEIKDYKNGYIVISNLFK